MRAISGARNATCRRWDVSRPALFTRLRYTTETPRGSMRINMVRKIARISAFILTG
jgi:hypothetical protein